MYSIFLEKGKTRDNHAFYICYLRSSFWFFFTPSREREMLAHLL